MKNCFFLTPLILLLSFSVLTAQEVCLYPAQPKLYDEKKLKTAYENFTDSLNVISIVHSYPKAIENLLSPTSKKKIIGLKTLAETREIEIIPWVAPLLDSEDTYVRSYASIALEKLVTGIVLQRRDPSHPERVSILPAGPEDPDLSPLAWVILKMFKSQDHTLNGKAATMTGYLNLTFFKKELQALTTNRHPANVRSAEYALDLLKNGHNK